MKICIKDDCRKKLDDDAEVCPDCNTPQPGSFVNVCRKCGATLKPHWIVCPECQTPVGGPKCKKCGVELKPHWTVCPECQTRVGEDVPPPDGPETPPIDQFCTNCKLYKQQHNGRCCIHRRKMPAVRRRCRYWEKA